MPMPKAYAEEILHLIPDQAFLSKRQLLPTKHYIELILNYHGMTYCADCQR